MGHLSLSEIEASEQQISHDMMERSASNSNVTMEAFHKCIKMQNVRLEFRSEKNGHDFISSGRSIVGEQVEFQCHTILEPIDWEMNVTLLSETGTSI
jgi:hypothetical protein